MHCSPPGTATASCPSEFSVISLASNTMKVDRALLVNVDHHGGDELGFEVMALSFPHLEFKNPNGSFTATGIQKLFSSDQNRKYATVLEHIEAPYIAGPLYYRCGEQPVPEDAQACFSETLKTDETLIQTALRGLGEEAGLEVASGERGASSSPFRSFTMKDCPLTWRQRFERRGVIITHYPIVLDAKELKPCASPLSTAPTAAAAAGRDDVESIACDTESKDSESSLTTPAPVDVKSKKVDVFIQGNWDEIVALAQSERFLRANKDIVACSSSQAYFIGGLVVFEVERLKKLVHRAMSSEKSAPLSKGLRVGGPPPAFGSKTVPPKDKKKSGRQAVRIEPSPMVANEARQLSRI